MNGVFLLPFEFPAGLTLGGGVKAKEHQGKASRRKGLCCGGSPWKGEEVLDQASHPGWCIQDAKALGIHEMVPN